MEVRELPSAYSGTRLMNRGLSSLKIRVVGRDALYRFNPVATGQGIGEQVACVEITLKI